MAGGGFVKKRKVASEHKGVTVENECMPISYLIKVAHENNLSMEAGCVSMRISYESTPCTSDFQRNLYMFCMTFSLCIFSGLCQRRSSRLSLLQAF